MNAKNQVKPEIRTAVEEGVKNFRNKPDRLESKIKKRYNTHEKITTEDVCRAITVLDNSQEEVVEFVADQIAKQVENKETGSVSMEDESGELQRPIATDGGSLFSDTTKNTFYVAMTAWNAFFFGLNISSGDRIMSAISLFSLVIFLSLYVNNNYDISIQVSGR